MPGDMVRHDIGGWGKESQRQSAGTALPFAVLAVTMPGAGRPSWAPSFVDYLYVSLLNATAFSPTDTMPLTTMA